VIGGDRGFLSEGVFEYELTGSALAMTLLRCTGTISRDDLATRRGLAGPDVPTPGAQMIGAYETSLGLVHAESRQELLERWERYALPLRTTPCAGGGDVPSTGTLLELDVPALSSVRRKDGAVAVTLWNPFANERAIRIGDTNYTLAPGRVETFFLS
jgi:hypothetical protein